MTDFNWNEAIEITQKLVRFNSYEAAGKRQAVEYVKELLESRTGAQVDIYDGETDEPFVIARMEKAGSRFRLLLDGHLDVVSPEGMEKAFDAELRGGVLFGRGTVDMKSGCAAILTAFIAAAKDETLDYDLYLMLSTDEEYADEEIKKAMENHLPKIDFAMIGEPSNGKIQYAHKGEAWVELEFFGRSAHSSRPREGKNAIYMAADYIEKLKALAARYEENRQEPYGTPTISLGVIEGGSTPNVVPPYAKAKLDIRYLPGQKIESFLEDLNAVMDECRAKDADFSGKVTMTGHWNAMYTDIETLLFKRIRAAIEQSLGHEVETAVMSGWGEGGFINRYGTPTIYFGPGDGKYSHTPEEQIEAARIPEAAKAYYDVIQALKNNER